MIGAAVVVLLGVWVMMTRTKIGLIMRATQLDRETAQRRAEAEAHDRPVVVEFVTDTNEMVFPMVPAGGSNDDIILSREDLR